MAFPLEAGQDAEEPRSRNGSNARPNRSSSASCSSASRRTSPAGSASGSPWVGRSSASPNAFLLDEPLSQPRCPAAGADARSSSRSCRTELGTTTIYVTHDQTEAMTLGDRVAVMRKGVFQQIATPKELYLHPANIFVAGFIGSPAMNFFPAEVNEGRRCELPMGEYEMPDELHGRPSRQVDRRDPARALRGRGARRVEREGREGARSRPRSTCSSGSAPSCSCTSRCESRDASTSSVARSRGRGRAPGGRRPQGPRGADRRPHRPGE